MKRRMVVRKNVNVASRKRERKTVRSVIIINISRYYWYCDTDANNSFKSFTKMTDIIKVQNFIHLYIDKAWSVRHIGKFSSRGDRFLKNFF